MIGLALAAWVPTSSPPASDLLSFDVKSSRGLTIRAGEIPIVTGSWFQYYEPDWSKGYYVSLSSEQKVETSPDGTITLTFQNGDGRAFGKQTFRKTPTGLKVRYEFGWKGSSPVNVELAGGMIWAPAFQEGKLSVQGVPQRSLLPKAYPKSGIEARTYGGNAARFDLTGPLGRLQVDSTENRWTLFDARMGYVQEWAHKDDLLWLGIMGLSLKPGQTKVIEQEWRFEGRNLPKTSEATTRMVARPLSQAGLPGQPLPLVPKPKVLESQAGRFVLGNAPIFHVPATHRALGGRLQRFLASLWRGVPQDPRALSGKPDATARIEGKIADLKLPAEGFEVRVDRSGAKVVGQDAAGLQHGLYALMMLARPEGGRLVIPYTRLRDWPSVSWRGVHMFVGPDSLPIHERLWNRALVPLRFNKAVIQCERADWAATPGIETEMTTRKADLVTLFDRLRSHGVEPIPLIQSFGHAEWLFANGKNLDIALNPASPYAMDPDKPRTREVLNGIWDEAAKLLKPKTFHFGLDEVDMIGYEGEKPDLTTRLWTKHLPFLGGIAERHKAGFMLWGDKVLAPGEAIDAALGDSPDHAARRRAVIPKNAWVADWHYPPNPNPDPYRKSLGLLKRERFQPIASTWFLPENIRGFSHAAALEGAGFLQTTWAGYVLNEKALKDEWRQFSAYLLAADYAWSARKELPSELDYRADDLLRRLTEMEPQPVAPVPGTSFLNGKATGSIDIGGIRFLTTRPSVLGSILLGPSASNPNTDSIAVPLKASGSRMALALRAKTRCADGTPVAELILVSEKGITRKTLCYGQHLRAAHDTATLSEGSRAVQGGLSAVVFDIKRLGLVREIQLRALSRTAGIELHGVTTL